MKLITTPYFPPSFLPIELLIEGDVYTVAQIDVPHDCDRILCKNAEIWKEIFVYALEITYVIRHLETQNKSSRQGTRTRDQITRDDVVLAYLEAGEPLTTLVASEDNPKLPTKIAQHFNRACELYAHLQESHGGDITSENIATAIRVLSEFIQNRVITLRLK